MPHLAVALLIKPYPRQNVDERRIFLYFHFYYTADALCLPGNIESPQIVQSPCILDQCVRVDWVLDISHPGDILMKIPLWQETLPLNDRKIV